MTALLVLLTIGIFILIDYLVYRKKGTAILQGAHAKEESIPIAPKKLKQINENDIALPSGVFFHPKHTWAHIMQSGRVKVGVDDFISKIVGSIDNVILPEVGANVKQGQPVFTLTSGDKKLDFVSPIEGKIAAVNSDVIENPSLTKNPYKNGWYAIIEPSNISRDIPALKIASDGVDWLKGEIRRFKEFLFESVNGNKLSLQTLPDGGLPTADILSQLDEENWKKFQTEFLNA